MKERLSLSHNLMCLLVKIYVIVVFLHQFQTTNTVFQRHVLVMGCFKSLIAFADGRFFICFTLNILGRPSGANR